VFSTIVVICISIPLFLTALLPLGILYTMIQRYYVATSRQVSRIDGVTRSPIYANFGETLSGVMTIKAYGREGSFEELVCELVVH
jgi:ABC-type multidrug transport system fused ATPase/permease subunit